ncbi:MAG: B12-binding domain-containing radical SAM protein [bacterium]
MKIIISYPPLTGRGSPMLTQNRQFQWYHSPSYIYPLTMAMGATLLKKEGFEVVWNDCIAEKLDYSEFLDSIQNNLPALIAFETKTPVIKQHWRIINHLKKEYGDSLKIALIGDHVTALPEESFKNSCVDFIIRGGNYDLLLLNIARHMRDKAELEAGIWYREGDTIRNCGDFSLVQDLNQLPFIDRSLTKASLYGEKWKRYIPFFYVQAGRDCHWHRCTFCSWTTLYPEFVRRSPTHLLDEIDMLVHEYHVKEIFDDTGTFPHGDWLDEFCEGMIERGLSKKILFSCNMRFGSINDKQITLMKRAGFRKLKMGMESAVQKTLDRLKKGVIAEKIPAECKIISSHGLDIHLTVMIGYPWESRSDIMKTLDCANNLMKNGYIEMLQATTAVPYPGTKLYEQAKEDDWFRIDPSDYEKYDMSEPILKTPGIEPEEITAYCQKLYRCFLTPGFIIRNITKVRSLNDLHYIYRGAKAVIGHIRDYAHG